MLDLIVVYPVEDDTHLTDKENRVLPDAYLMPRGSTAKDLAYIYTIVGEYDEAINQIEYLLSVPGESSISLLRCYPTWDLLRDHPRFKKLLESDE